MRGVVTVQIRVLISMEFTFKIHVLLFERIKQVENTFRFDIKRWNIYNISKS